MSMTVYFVSSRSCGNNEAYRRWLLYHSDSDESKVEKDYNLMIGSQGSEVDKDFIYDVLIKDLAVWRDKAETLSSANKDDLIDIISSIPEERSARTEKAVKAAKENIADYLDDFRILTGISAESKSFKEVYRLKVEGIGAFLSVNELSEKDRQDLAKSKTLWCDLIINSILDRNQGIQTIHLLLHDQDVDGFSKNSIETISSASNCKNHKLISEAMLNRLSDSSVSSVTITFFKHDNPLVRSIIGENVDLDTSGNRMGDKDLAQKLVRNYYSMLEQTGVIGELKEMANKQERAAQ